MIVLYLEELREDNRQPGVSAPQFPCPRDFSGGTVTTIGIGLHDTQRIKCSGDPNVLSARRNICEGCDNYINYRK